jgi:hypothetical protein
VDHALLARPNDPLPLVIAESVFQQIPNLLNALVALELIASVALSGKTSPVSGLDLSPFLLLGALFGKVRENAAIEHAGTIKNHHICFHFHPSFACACACDIKNKTGLTGYESFSVAWNSGLIF